MITMIDSSFATLPFSCSSTIDKKITMLSFTKVIKCKQIKNIRVSSLANNKNEEIDHLFRGTLDESTHLFTKHFLVPSCPLGFDSNVSMRTIMSMMQDMGVSHCKASWPGSSTGFGLTKEMIKRELFWVSYRNRTFIESYPSCDDVIKIESLLSLLPGKNIFVGEGLVRNHDTGEILIRTTIELLLVNKRTRKFEKITDEVKKEMKPYLVENNDPIMPEETRIKLPQFDFNSPYKIQTGLLAYWGDLDANKHVNNAKYIEWIFQSIPRWILESKELSKLIINYKKECDIESVVESLTSLVDESDDRSLEMQHLLRLKCGPEVARAITTWRPKQNTSVDFSKSFTSSDH